MSSLLVREDLTSTQSAVWASVGHAGTTWTGVQRVELAAEIVDALSDPEPLPPWALATDTDRAPRAAPAVAHDIVRRIARHAGTVTKHWYDRMVVALGAEDEVSNPELAYVELASLVCQVTAVWSFRHAAGLSQLPLPTAVAGVPTGNSAPLLGTAVLSWVPVAAPPDERAAVVQAFSALPDEHQRIWRLAAAQYIPDLEMVDPEWTRGPLTRDQLELVACRVAELRECFY